MKIIVGTSDAVLDKAGTLIQAAPADWIGARLAGLFFSWLFLGMLFIQAAHYYQFYPRDPKWLKFEVALAVVLSCLKTIQEVIVSWDKCITHFGNYRNAAAVGFYAAGEPLWGHLMALSATWYFIHRCFALTNRNWIVLGLILAMEVVIIVLGVFVLLHFYYDPYYMPDTKKYGYPFLAMTMAVDTFITSVVTWKLLDSRKGFNKNTDLIVTRLLRLTWETALPPALFALLNLLVYHYLHNKNLVHTSFNMITPRLYVFAFMYTLNIRGKLRVVPGTSQTGGEETWAEQDRTKRSAVPLSVLSKGNKSFNAQTFSATGRNGTGSLPIHVHTETVAQVSTGDGYVRDLDSAKPPQIDNEDASSLDSFEKSEKKMRRNGV